MAYSLSTQLQAALDDSERYSAVLVSVQMGANTYGFWTGQDVLPYNGIDYVAAGSLVNIADIEQLADGSVSECKIKLGLDPEKDFTDGEINDAILSFYDEDWQFARVVIQLAMLDPVTLDPIGIVTFMRGVIYEAPLDIDADTNYIEARVVSQNIKLSENGGIYRNNATQARIDPSDTALKDIGSIGAAIVRQLKWGQS